MSKRKRRKVSNDISDDDVKVVNFKSFRLKILKQFLSGRSHFFEKYSYSFYNWKHTEGDDIPRQGEDTNEKSFLEGNFGLLTDEDKILRILHYKKSGPTELAKVLMKVNYKKLKKLFYESFGRKRAVPSKQVIANSLVSKFYGKDPSILKRESEEGIVNSIEDLRDLQSVEFDGIYVSVDVVSKILSYLEYNKTLLYDCGRVCKGLYVTILCTWPKISLSKIGLYDISVLVLNNVREVRIVEKRTKNKFILREMEYIMKNLSSVKLRKVTFECSVSAFRNTLTNIQKCLKKKSIKVNCFQHVNEVEFCLYMASAPYIVLGDIYRLGPDYFKSKCEPMSTVFPSVTSFIDPIFLPMVDGLKLSRLEYVVKINNSQAYGHHMKRLYSIEKLKESVNEKNLMELSVGQYLYTAEVKDEYLFELLKHFNRIQTFRIRVSNMPLLYGLMNESLRDTELDYSFLSHAKDLRQLHISRGEVNRYCEKWTICHPYPTKYFHSSGGINNLRHLNHIVINTDMLIDSQGIINILKNMKKMKRLRVTYMTHSADEYLDEVIASIPNIEFVHLEMKVVKKEIYLRARRENWSSRNSLSDYHLGPVAFMKKYDEHCVMIERSIKSRKLIFGTFSLVGFRTKKPLYTMKSVWGNVIDSPPENVNSKEEEEEEAKDLPFPAFSTISIVTNNLCRLLEGIKNVRIFCKEKEKNVIMDWKGMEEVIISEMKFKKLEVEEYPEFFPHVLDVNEDISNETLFAGYFEMKDDGTSEIVKRKMIFKEYCK